MPGKTPTIISAFEFPPSRESQPSLVSKAAKEKSLCESGTRKKRSVSSAPSCGRSGSKSGSSQQSHLRQRRVKSAVDGRPLTLCPSDSPWGNKEWGRSQYTSDYGPKRPPSPIHIRPASATRMNNPHPSNVSNISNL